MLTPNAAQRGVRASPPTATAVKGGTVVWMVEGLAMRTISAAQTGVSASPSTAIAVKELVGDLER